VMLKSPVEHLISFASSLCIMRNTHHSDTATMWFNVVDSQWVLLQRPSLTLQSNLAQPPASSTAPVLTLVHPSVSATGIGATRLACVPHMLPNVCDALVLILGTIIVLTVIAARAIQT
jgi:hypothetical protein